MRRLFAYLALASVCACGKPDIEVECGMNGYGAGSCDFTNTGTASGALCGNVIVGRDYGNPKLIESSKFCSGDVDVKTTKKVEFRVSGVDEFCKLPGKTWSEVCDFKFRSDDMDREFEQVKNSN